MGQNTVEAGAGAAADPGDAELGEQRQHHRYVANLYHFSHRFSRRNGMPPSAYRAADAPAHSALDHPGVRRLAHAPWP